MTDLTELLVLLFLELLGDNPEIDPLDPLWPPIDKSVLAWLFVDRVVVVDCLLSFSLSLSLSLSDFLSAFLLDD